MPDQRPRLREARQQAGLTQRAVANELGMVRPVIARWEAGGRIPAADTAVLLARAVGSSVEAIWGDEQDVGTGDQSQLRDVPQWLTDFIAASRWTFAKTMPEQPHEYVVKNKTAAAEPFERAVAFIHDHGYSEVFAGRYYRYYEPGDGWRYWSQGLSPEATTVINRARLDQSQRRDQPSDQSDRSGRPARPAAAAQLRLTSDRRNA